MRPNKKLQKEIDVLNIIHLRTLDQEDIIPTTLIGIGDGVGIVGLQCGVGIVLPHLFGMIIGDTEIQLEFIYTIMEKETQSN
jgi:hypothetical protein